MWSWRVDSEVAGVAALVAADAAAFQSAFCPSLFTIRAFRSSNNTLVAQETANDLYRGMALGATLTMITGFGGSAVTQSYWPLAAAIFTTAVLIAAYMWAIQNPRGSSGIADQ